MVQKNSLRKIIVICGPTASGKTSLAVECALRLGGEVVCADSMTVYQGLDIGTAKPTEAEKRGIIHHMVDVVSPTSEFSVGDYRDKALPIINGIYERGKIPVVCGGTGFYINSILFDFSYGTAPKNEEVRKNLEHIAESLGRKKLHSMLEEVDPESASALHENDVKRVVRALEIFYTSGKKRSELNDGETPQFDYSSFMIDFPREELYARINSRVDQMIELGLIEEVKGLLARGIDDNFQCMQGIGYKEVVAGLKRNDDIVSISEEIKMNTRRYAKRQIAFFKRDDRLEYLPPLSSNVLANIICEKIR